MPASSGAVEPRVSVVVPSFNQGRFIGEALLSILEQETAMAGTSDVEVIVRDGGSTDETLEVLRSFGDRVRWVSEVDGGQAAAVNLGWSEASGDILGWLNSDDLYLPGAIDAVTEAFRSNPAVDVVYGEGVYVSADGTRIGRYGTRGFDRERLLGECFICQPTVFIRRRVFERYGGPRSDLRFCMDYEYWVRLGGGATFLKLDRELAVTRWYPDTKTLADRYAVHHEICGMLREKLGYVPLPWVGAWTSVWLDGLAWLRPLRGVRSIWLALITGCTLGNALRHSGVVGMLRSARHVRERIGRLARRVSTRRETGMDGDVFGEEGGT